ncbi:hypothetical protein, partial [Bacteroides sp.]|uniref:hypothetical protein n=1 Tax=Bacteroides sp. TaxID=29523 RepID=UPI002582631C
IKYTQNTILRLFFSTKNTQNLYPFLPFQTWSTLLLTSFLCHLYFLHKKLCGKTLFPCAEAVRLPLLGK